MAVGFWTGWRGCETDAGGAAGLSNWTFLSFDTMAVFLETMFDWLRSRVLVILILESFPAVRILRCKSNSFLTIFFIVIVLIIGVGSTAGDKKDTEKCQ